jgi:hypothetical protein
VLGGLTATEILLRKGHRRWASYTRASSEAFGL